MLYHIERGDGPLVAAALHDGHAVRDDVAPLLALSASERLREEDPFTARWVDVAPTRIVGLHSRFEVDLNRPREGAVYRRPEDAWGLRVWKEELPEAVFQDSLARYDAFYDAVRSLLDEKVDRYGGFVVLDLHSYNHRRGGPEAGADDPEANPEVNLGTGTMDRAYWAPVVEAFLRRMRGLDVGGRRLDVRENVRFRGGYFPRWIHENYPEKGCALAVEFKKLFMDEWTGVPDERQIRHLRLALVQTVPDVLEAFHQVNPPTHAQHTDGQFRSYPR